MSASIINATCNALSVVDLIAITGVFIYFNKRITLLEKNTGIKSSSSSAKKIGIEDRVITLENEIEVLLQRLHVYDDLFMKMMSRMKELGEGPDKLTIEEVPQLKVSTPSSTIRRTSIKRRANSIIARREPFVDEESIYEGDNIENHPISKEPESKNDESDEDDMFSFLMD